MITRYITSASLGITMTVSLLYLMQTLIDSGSNVLEPVLEIKLPIWIASTPKDLPPKVIEKPAPIPPPPVPPSPVPPTTSDDSGIGVTTIVPPTVPPKGLPDIGFRPLSDGPLVSIVRVQPLYPARALAQGLEGYVTVEFDVSAQGTVMNVVVLDSSHAVFENAAVTAAYRFRFKPRVVDGIPLSSTGMRNRFRFELRK